MSEMTMVERVALAISGGKDPASVLAIHRDRARLAIAAMRAPDNAMHQAALAYCEGCHKGGDTPNLEGYWHAMIDAALRESPGEPQAHQRARQEQGGA